nr:transglycosylase domain-containing protein [Acidobacteriota bacterium]
MGKAKPRARSRVRGWRIRIPRARWKRGLLGIGAGLALVTTVVLGYYYIEFSRIIEARLHGERDRVIPRVFARPLRLHTGQGLTETELVARLNDVGYTETSRVERSGEFALSGRAIAFVPRGGDQAGKPVRVLFAEAKVASTSRRVGAAPPGRIERVEAGGQTVDDVTIDPPMLAGLVTGSREKRRRVPLATIPQRMQQAVLAIEDRRFFTHPGVDPIGLVAAVATNLTTDRRVGRSTVTQQ